MSVRRQVADHRTRAEAIRAILAAGQTAPAADPAPDEPHCTEDRHIILPSGESCVCGDNRTELLL